MLAYELVFKTRSRARFSFLISCCCRTVSSVGCFSCGLFPYIIFVALGYSTLLFSLHLLLFPYLIFVALGYSTLLLSLHLLLFVSDLKYSRQMARDQVFQSFAHAAPACFGGAAMDDH